MTIGTTTPTRNATGTMMRIVLTLVGAGMMVIGAFMPWVRSVLGTNLSWKAFYSTDLGHAHSFEVWQDGRHLLLRESLRIISFTTVALRI